MKTIKIIYVILICPLLFACDGSEMADDSAGFEPYDELIEQAVCTNIPRPADAYVFPFVPGTKEWIGLREKGMKEVIKAYQIPGSILKKLSTPAVIQAFFDFPYFFLYTASSSTLLNGLQFSVNGNSAYPELLKRKDAGKCLLDVYILFNPVGCSPASIMFPLLELVLSQPEFYSQLNMDEKKLLVKTGLEKIKIYMDYDPSTYLGNEMTCLLMGRIMQSAVFDPFANAIKSDSILALYLEEQTYQFDDFDMIIAYAKQFVK